MAKNLVIVESPSKSKTIKKMLGSNYTIKASYGHVIDLPKTTLGIDIEKGYKPRYKVIKGKEEVLNELKEAAKKADNVYLASDPDREGEAIAWHIANYIKEPKKIKRIEFNEITKTAVQRAVKNPREIDMKLVDAQQARRILDRIVGYKISPLLWKKINKNASAGRVQSVALKLVCDLEDEIRKFVPEKYFDIALLINDGIKLELSKISGKKVDKLKDESHKDKIKELLKDGVIEVSEVQVKKKKQEPPLPFKTSTLQQLASTYLDFSPSRTMSIAQQLYEGINIGSETKGLITYMRTDSTRIAKEASEQAQEFIAKTYGKENCGKNRVIKSKNSQDAHEAIRPSDVYITPDIVEKNATKDQYKLYKLIWERFIISQFAPVEYEQFKMTAQKEIYEFSGTLNKVIKEGYYKIYKNEENLKTSDFPSYKEGDILKIKELMIKEDMTKPPAKYTESSLVKKLESLGIGRPSTYASILDNIKKKNYIEIKEKKLTPTLLGYEVKNELEKNFKDIMNVKFTANLEEHLDLIADGVDTMEQVIDIFYKSLNLEVEKYQKQIEELKNRVILTDVMCSNGVDHMVFKTGIYGKYLVCETDETQKLSINNVEIDEKQIEEGFLYIKDKISKVEVAKDLKTNLYTEFGSRYVLKKGRFGYYLESEDYERDNQRLTLEKRIQKMIEDDKIPIENDELLIKSFVQKEIDRKKDILNEAGNCDKCGKPFTIKKGRFGEFLACSDYPNCKNIKSIKKRKK